MHVTCNTVLNGQFSRPFENKTAIFRVEGVSYLAFELCDCVEISVNQILTNYGHLVQLHCDLGGGGVQRTVRHHNPTSYGPLVQWHCTCFFGEFKITKHFHQQKHLKSKYLLSMGMMQIIFKWWQKVYHPEQILC